MPVQKGPLHAWKAPGKHPSGDAARDARPPATNKPVAPRRRAHACVYTAFLCGAQ